MIFKRFRNKSKTPKQKKRPKRSNPGPSIITAEVVIDGHLLSGGELQIDGEVNGDVRAQAVVVDINGMVHGQVAAEDVIVRGRIIGPIRALHVHLLNGCHVEGDVLNETISIENGAFIDGQVHRVDDPLGDSRQPEVRSEASAYTRPARRPTTIHNAAPDSGQSQYGYGTANPSAPHRNGSPNRK